MQRTDNGTGHWRRLPTHEEIIEERDREQARATWDDARAYVAGLRRTGQYRRSHFYAVAFTPEGTPLGHFHHDRSYIVVQHGRDMYERPDVGYVFCVKGSLA